VAVATARRPLEGSSRSLLIGAAAAVVVAATVTWIGRTGDAADPRVEGTTSLAAAEFEDATGVRIVQVAATAGGGLLDLRYQVLDPDKALVVHDQDRPPALLSRRTGTVLAQRWHNHVTTRSLKHAVVYHELLVNTGGAIGTGDDVSVLVGDWRLDGVGVE
jgi:hypothetical protein